MPLPAASSPFPAATGGFPASPAAQDPMFGVNPYAPATNMYVPKLFDPTAGIPDLAARAAQQQQLLQMAQLSNLGIAPETDPHTWTPEEATLQTDQAIAKIATVNPDVAERLAAQRAPGEDDGGGFWDSLKDVAGDIFAPALSIGGKVLDIVSRTANIVPNLAFDAIDGGDFSFADDIGGALSGNMRHNWNSVFQEMGWEGGGVGGFLRATVGLAGDVLTDPLTWIIPAGAGVKSAEAAATLGEKAATKTGSLLEEAAKVYGQTGDELAETVMNKYQAITKGLEEQGVKLGDHGVDVQERIAGLIGTEAKVGEATLLADQLELADRVYRGARTRSFETTLGRGGELTLSSGRKVAGTEVKGVLEQAVKDGAWNTRASSEWAHARQVSSAMGGLRFKTAIPFTRLRYISPALPGTKLLGEKTIGFVSRMASGQSGMNRMATAIRNGDGEVSDLVTWMEDGWDAAKLKNPDLVDTLGGKGKNLGSMFYSASEQMGRITAHLDSGATASRSGLAGYYAHAETLRIKNTFNNFVRETAYNVQDGNGRIIQREQLLRDMESRLGTSLRKSKVTATPEQLQSYARYLDYFPASLDTSSPEAIEAWYASLKRQGPQTAEEAARDADKLLRMKQTAAALNPQQRETLDQLSHIWEHARNEAAKKDAVVGDVRMAYEQVGILHPEQAAEWGAGGHPIFDEVFYMDTRDASKRQYLGSQGIDESAVEAGEQVTGVQASRVAGGGAGVTGHGTQVPVRMRMHNPIVIDRRTAAEGAVLDHEQLLLDARDEADRVIRDQGDAIDAALERPVGTHVATGENQMVASDLVTAKLRKERPEADGLVIIEADGSVTATAFEHTNVKVVSDSAPRLVQERGYFHRSFTKESREWLRGKIPRDGKKLLIAEPEVEAFLNRQTIGMDIDEAESYIRGWLSKTYEGTELPERIWDLDPVRVHEAYIEKMGNAIAAEMVGKASRRIVALGDLAPALFGKAARDQRVEWGMSAELLRNLARKDTKLARTIMESHARDAALVEEQHAQLQRTAEQYGLFAAMVEESLASGVEVPDRFVMAARKYGATVSDAESKISKEIAGIEETEGLLRQDLTTYDAALEQVKTDPGVGHPGPADPVSVVDLGDGRQRVAGWHGRVDLGPPVLEGEGIEFSNNGFHLGDYVTAKARVDADVEAMGKTIGHRNDPRTWPTREVEQPWPARVEGETDEAFEARLDAIPVVPATEVPVPPDYYYEDVLYPVEADGNFAGRDTPLAEGSRIDEDNLPPPGLPDEARARYDELQGAEDALLRTKREASTRRAQLQRSLEGTLDENPEVNEQIRQLRDVERGIQAELEEATAKVEDEVERLWQEHPVEGQAGQLGASFSGSARGESATKAADRGALEAEGYTGAIYANAVEGVGTPSVVVLEPTDVRIATGTQQFEKAVADGKVFRAPDGSFTTKRVRGSRRLTSRTAATEQLDKLATRRDELEKLRRSLLHGDDAYVRPAPFQKFELPREVAPAKLLHKQDRADPWKDAGDEGFSVEELADSIADEGFKRGKEVKVQYDPRNGRYRIADGYHRTQAMDVLNEPTVPVFWEEAVLSDRNLPVFHERVGPSLTGVDAASKSLGQTAAAKAAREGKVQFAMGKKLKRLNLATHNAMNEANKAYAEFHGALAKVKPALHKVETAGDLNGLTRLHVPGLEGYAMPHYIAEEFHSIIDKHGIGNLRESWRQYVMGPWKRWATYRWPGFHVRNFFGAHFNNWLGGVVMPDYNFSWRVNHARDGSLKWAGKAVSDAEFEMYNLKRVFGARKPTYDEVANLLSEQGIGRANTMAVMGIGTATEATQEVYRAVGKSSPNMVRRASRKFDGTMRQMGSSVEDFHRIAAWGRGMASTQGDTYGARAFVMMRHGDYADLTDAEDFIRDLIPFYKWMRTNTPYQLRMLAENPAALTLVHDKFERFGYEAQGLSREEGELQQADYMKQSLAVPIPDWVPFVGSKDKDALKFAMFDLPYGDLYNGLNDYLSSALPVGRNVLESYGFKQQLFSGVPLEGKYKPLSGVFNLPGVRDLLTAAKLTQKGPDGQLYMEDKLQNVLMAWPVFSRFRNFTESDPSRVDARTGGIFSLMAGVGIKEGDYTNAELDFYYNEVRPLLDQYKSLGIQMPTIDDIQSGHVGATVGLTSGEAPASPFLTQEG